MEWKKDYQSRLLSVEDAAKKIESGDKIWLGPCSSAPIQLMESICDRVNELENVDVVTGMALYPYKFLKSEEFIGRINFHTVFYGAIARNFYKVGNVNVNSVHLSEVTDTVRKHYKVDTLIADVSLPDEDGYMYYGPMGVALNGEIAEISKKIIVQVNKYQPKVVGTKHKIHVSEVDYICEFDHELPELKQPPVQEIEQKIADLILPRIPDGATIQLGLGGLSNAIGYGLESKKNLSVHTEMFTDSMVYLAKKGVISGNMLAAFGLGNQELYDFVGEGHVKLAPISYVNNPNEIAKNDNFVSINSCLMSDLTGQVCSEGIGHFMYSSTGGQLDYVKGASKSKGGQGYLCLPSTILDKQGNLKSTITLNLPGGAVITTPRTEVMNVVTEFGVAELHHKPVRERVEAMISIAHPDFREQLREEAINAGLIK